MKFFESIIILGPFLLGLWGCSKSDSPGVTTTHGTPVYEFKTPEAMLKAAQNYSLSCESGALCPQNMGTLIAQQGPRSFSSCTFSLIDKDLILTNRHCVPDAIAFKQASCQGKINFLFYSPTSPLGREVVGCDQIISLPEEYDPNIKSGRDFAIIKLKSRPSSTGRREAFALSKQGARDKEILTAYVSVPDQGQESTSSTLKSFQCKVIMGSAFNPYYQSSVDPVMSLRDCPIVYGDSGAPIANTKNEIVGVIQAGIIENQEQAQSPAQAEEIQDAVQKKLRSARLAEATQSICLEIPSLGVVAPHTCFLSSDQQTAAIAAQTENLFNAERVKQELIKLQKKFNDSDSLLDWSLLSDSAKKPLQHKLFTVVFIPKCFKGSLNNNTWMKAAAPSNIFSKEIELQKLVYNISLTEDLKYKLGFEKVQERAQITFDIRSLKTLFRSTTKLILIRQNSSFSQVVESYKVGFCN